MKTQCKHEIHETIKIHCQIADKQTIIFGLLFLSRILDADKKQMEKNKNGRLRWDDLHRKFIESLSVV